VFAFEKFFRKANASNVHLRWKKGAANVILKNVILRRKYKAAFSLPSFYSNFDVENGKQLILN
jgi:hypothetical protein